MSLVAEIMARLSSQSVGSTSSTAAWRLVARELLPATIGGSTQAQMIAVIPTGGFQQEATEPLLRPTFQVQVRGSSTGSTGLEAKVDAVRDALNLWSSTGILGRRMVDCQMQGDVLWLERDENDNPIYGLNFVAFRSRTT